MCNRGDRRKKTFTKAKHNAETYEIVTGLSLEEEGLKIGCFKKDSCLNTYTDFRKTNSEWCGRQNFKQGDKKRFAKCEAEKLNYEKQYSQEADV